MDVPELHTSTSYHAGLTEMTSPDTSSHTYGNVYATGNAVIHLGDSIHSQHGCLPEDFTAINRLEERQRKTGLQSLLNVLCYETMDDRRAKLKSVSEGSVAWVWNTNFRSWLATDEPFFWITGKPGSGKSTLLKCLCSSRNTTEVLHGTGHEWITLDFYFDNNAGAAIANSAQGLLQSFLYQLISKLEILGQYMYKRYSHALHGRWLQHESELINTLCEGLVHSNAKVCAFVDGIDEFTGKLRDLISVLKDIQNRTGMKICLASRPDKMISRSFGTCSSLQVEAHNAATIQNYIATACEALTDEEIESSQSLWHLIEQEANGIILWARFVVDEVIDQIVVGATMKELEDTLQTFPTEMEAVYERVLRDLTEEQKLHAAVAFYVLEHGLTSFNSGNEIPIYEFFVTWTIMVETFSRGIKFDSNFDIKRFQIRIEAMLGGLLEFSPSGTVRFVHATFESYLRRTSIFSSITESAIRPAYRDGFAGQIFLHVIGTASKQVSLDLEEIGIEDLATFYSETLSTDDILAYISLADPKGHFGHRLDFLLTAIGRLGQVLLDSARQAENVWEVVNSPLFELHQVLCTHVGCRCTHDFRSNSTFWQDRWCLYFLASHGLFFAFECGIRQTRRESPDAQTDMLEVTVDVVRKAQLELEQANSKSDMAKPKRSSFGLNGHQLIDLLLETEPLNSSHLALCQIIEFPKDSQLVRRARNFRTPTDYQASIPSTWFPYPQSNLLCCWAWCSDPCYSRHVQASRLQSLLEMGFDINVKAYVNGTVLHALFDYQEPVPISSHTRLHHVTWPFSAIKFNLIREAGFDFASPQANDLLEHARKFQSDLVRRTQWVKLRPEERKQISDLDSFVRNVLEPLCRPRFTTIWRIGSPTISDHSPTSASPRVLPLRTSNALRDGRPRGSRDGVLPSYGPFLLMS